MAAGLLAPLLSAHPQTCIFLTLGFAQLAVALALRSPVGRRTWRQRGLEVAVAVSVLLQLMGVYLPALNELLGTRPLPYPALLVGLVLAALPALLVLLVRVTPARVPVPR